jgi:integrase
MPLTIYRRGKIWHYRGTVAGRLLRGTCGTPDKKTAQRITAEKETQQWKARLDGPAAVLTFSQAAAYYRKAGKATRFLTILEDYWQNTPVREVTRGAIRQSAIVLLPEAMGSTRNRQVIVPTQAIINHAASLDFCAPIRVKRFPVLKSEKDPATWEWVQAFMAAASPHLAALACFMFLTGARISEAVDLRWRDVDLSARRAKIRQTKLGNERWAHLPPPLVAAIDKIPSNRELSEKLFRYSSSKTAQPVWRKAIERAGIKPLSFHACRHGFATAMLHAGVDPVTTAKRGGWKSAAHVFATYGHAMDDETVTDRIISTPEAQIANSGQKIA